MSRDNYDSSMNPNLENQQFGEPPNPSGNSAGDEDFVPQIALALGQIRFAGRGARRGHGGHGHDGRRHSGRHWGALNRLLLLLARSTDPLSITDVAKQIGVDQPRSSRLVKQATEEGMVERIPDPRDARRSYVALTQEGRKRAEKISSRHEERVREALVTFTAAEEEQLAGLLDKLAAAWNE